MGKPTRVSVYLRLPPSLRDRLVEAARDTGVSINAYAEHALAMYLDFLRYERNTISSDELRRRAADPDAKICVCGATTRHPIHATGCINQQECNTHE